MRAPRNPPLSSHYVILEPNYRGHRMNYCVILVEQLMRLQFKVTLATTSDAIASEEFRLRFSSKSVEIADIGKLMSIEDPGYFRWLRDKIVLLQESFGGARIIALEGDKLLPHVLLLPTACLKRTSLLLMRAPGASPVKGAPARIRDFMKAALSLVVRFRGADIIALATPRPRQGAYRVHGFRATPDPIDVLVSAEDRARWQEVLRDDGGPRHWIGIVGAINSRKNPGLTARALAGIAHQQPIGLVLAGKLDPDEAERIQVELDALRAAGGRVVVVDRLLTDGELDSLIAELDVCAVMYATNGPSGILGKAAAVGTVVATGGSATLEREAQKLGIGGAHSAVLNADGIAAALIAALAMDAPRPQPMAGAIEFATSLVGVADQAEPR